MIVATTTFSYVQELSSRDLRSARTTSEANASGYTEDRRVGGYPAFISVSLVVFDS